MSSEIFALVFAVVFLIGGALLLIFGHSQTGEMNTTFTWSGIFAMIIGGIILAFMIISSGGSGGKKGV